MDNPASGSLVDINLVDILQVLSVNRKSCTLYLKKGPERGEIALRDGRIIDAKTGAQRGEPAFFYLLGWEGADFFISSGANLGMEPTITKDFHPLIMEWMEKKEALGEAPPEAGAEVHPPVSLELLTPPAVERIPAPSPVPSVSPEEESLRTLLKILESRGVVRTLP